ncbi:Uncharacterised protein [Mycobacteroides abscessus]|nr:Uncharacterised protein [Mycobacteroides abscessus]
MSSHNSHQWRPWVGGSPSEVHRSMSTAWRMRPMFAIRAWWAGLPSGVVHFSGAAEVVKRVR